MLTNQFIKAHGQLLTGQLDQSSYEKLDVFQDVEVIGEIDVAQSDSPITNNPLTHICYSEDGNYYYNFSAFDGSNTLIEKRDSVTHGLIISNTVDTSYFRYLIGGYERDGKLYVCQLSQHTAVKDHYFVVDLFNTETLVLELFAYGGSQFQHIGDSTTGTGFKALGTFYHFSKTVDYIFFWNSYSDGSDPAVIRIDYTSIDEDHNAWTHFYSTNAGTGVTTEDAINGIVVENYEDPTQVKLAIRLYYIDGFVIGDWQSDGTAQAYLRVDFKDFDDTEFINETNYKFLDITGLKVGSNDPEDKAAGIVFGKNNQSCVFRYNLADVPIDNYTQFYCKINFTDWTTQWWPHAPTGPEGNLDFPPYIPLGPVFSRNKDLLFAVGIKDMQEVYQEQLYFHVIDADTMVSIASYPITTFPTTGLPYDVRAGYGSAVLSNNDKTVITYTGGRFNQGAGAQYKTQTVTIDTDLSIGSDTLGTLNLIEHAYGTDDKPESPTDVKLGEELARKAFLSELLFNNMFVATTQLNESELNGFTLKEASVQSLNNNMIMRSNIDRFKNENVILDFQSNIRNAGEKGLETSYLESELTKFYNGTGVPENVKMMSVLLLHNGSNIAQIPILEIIPIDDVTFKVVVEYTPANEATVSRFQVLNSLNTPLQDVRFNEKTLLANTKYKFEIIVKGKEVL